MQGRGHMKTTIIRFETLRLSQPTVWLKLFLAGVTLTVPAIANAV
jgi:hypothetical protein